MSYHREVPFHEQDDISPEMHLNTQKRVRSEDGTENPLSRPAKQQKSASGSPDHSQIPRLQHGNYTIGWICALHIEMAAARAMLDSIHDSPPTSPNDTNAYTLGSIGPHNIVMACLPTSFYGTNNAANVASNMIRSFPAIRVFLMVGIGGGVPGDIDLRLGDIVVGCKVMQYDLGKVIGDGLFRRTCTPRTPPQDVLRCISLLRSDHEMKPSRVSSILQEMQKKQPEMDEYARPNHLQDRLFHADYDHDPTKPDCNECDDSMEVIRASRTDNGPKIHYGGIASGNQVMKNGIKRDEIARELDVICFEMEAAGLMDNFPCLVIRGICDYSDSHKNKEWQKYSAACAAAYAKEFLERRRADVLINNKEVDRCRRDLFLTDPFEDRQALKRKIGDRVLGTCQWIVATEQFCAWMFSRQMTRSESQKTDALWIHGNPGTGKSTMAIFLSEFLWFRSVSYGYTHVYFFCDSGFDKRNTATSVIRGLLWQLVDQHPQLLFRHIVPKYKERGPEIFKSFDTLWLMFVAAAADQNTGRKWCIILIDALDECDEESQKILLQQFQELFQRRQNAPLDIKLLVTSRPYSIIYEYLGDFLNKDITSFPQAKRDIDRCIEQHITHLTEKKKYTEKVQNQVRSILQAKAEGTFLWVGLVCEELRQQPSNQAIKLLQGMPKGLQLFYKQLLDKACEGSEAETVRRILNIVVISLQPLSILELAVACSLHEDEVDIETRVQFTRESIESCRLMVIIQNEKVLLLHQSIKDYLLGNGTVGFIDETKAHSDLTHICVTILIKHCNNLQSHVPLLSYAIKNWPHHARMAKSRFEVKKSEADFFGVTSTSREKWLAAFTSSEYRHGFSILHVAGQFGIPALVDHISSLQEQKSDQEKSINSLDINQACSHGITPLEQAVESGYLTVISKLLDLKVKVTGGVVLAAVKNTNNGKEVMELLLRERGNEIVLTKKIIIDVVGHWNGGKEVMKVLLTQKRNEITITEEVVKAAAGNVDGKEAIELLLNEYGDEITITEEVIKAAAGSLRGKEAIELFLNEYGDEITITEEVIKAAAESRGGKEAIELLLNKYGDEITITEEVVKAAAENYNYEVFKFLLSQRRNKITITDAVISTLTRHSKVKEMMKCLLYERGDEITITESIASIIASNCDAEVMGLLISHQGDQIIITEEVIRAAAGNHNDVLRLLLRHQRNPIAITKTIVSAAFCNSNGRRGAMALLLDKQRKDLIIVTEQAIPAIATWCNKEVMELLFEGRGDEITITEEVTKAAAGNLWKNGPELIKFLLKDRGDEITITEEVVKATVGNIAHGKEVIGLLLSQRGHEFIITEEIMKAAAGNKSRGKEVIELLLNERGDEIIITEEVVEAAARCGSDEILNLLYQQKNKISDWDKWYCISQAYKPPKSKLSLGDILRSIRRFKKGYIEI